MEKSTNIIHRSNYIIYIDDVRVDQFVVSWSATTGLSANQTNASITFFRSPAMDDWKSYLSRVKIFAENPFSRKYSLVFEGDITNRSWGEKRSHMGTMTLHCSGFYHWLEVKVPMGINVKDEMNPLQRFIYEAQNINIDEVRELVMTDSEVMLKDNNIQGIIDQLFTKITTGYYEAAGDDTNFGFTNVKERFAILSDVKEEFRESGFLDLFTFSKATYIDSFTAFFMEVIEQLMMEFYQDRDGTLKVKFPGWGEDLLYSHIIDASIVEQISGVNNWVAEPTRVLAIGSATQLQQAMSGRGDMTGDFFHDLSIPIGLYIGDPRRPDTEEYYSATLELQVGGGEGGGDFDDDGYEGGSVEVGEGGGSAVKTDDWYDDLPNYSITQSHYSTGGRARHMGVDYSHMHVPLYNLGTNGVVIRADHSGQSMGGIIIVQQEIEGRTYEFIYMHLSAFNVKPGDRVKPGQRIGTTGATGFGYSGQFTGAHLHFEVWLDKWCKGGYEPGNTYNLHPEHFMSKFRHRFAETGSVGIGGSGGKRKKSMAERDYDPEVDGDDSGEVESRVTRSGKTTKAPKGLDSSLYVKPSEIKGAITDYRATRESAPKEADLRVDKNYNTPIEQMKKMLGKNAGLAKHYVKYGNQYGIDPSFVLALTIFETGHFTSAGWLNKNNPGGIMDPATNSMVLMRFSSQEEAIRYTFWNLQDLYINNGLITPRVIQPVYTPVGAANDPNNTNGGWLSGVVNVWNECRGITSAGVSEFSPNAGSEGGGGGRGFTLVNYPKSLTKQPGFINRAISEGMSKFPVEKGLDYHDSLSGKIPTLQFHLTAIINSYSGKLAPSLIIAIISQTTQWREKYNTTSNVGIMGVSKYHLTDKEVSNSKIAQFSIFKGVEIINNARSKYFDGNPFFATAYMLAREPKKVIEGYKEHKRDLLKFILANGKDWHVQQLVRIMESSLGAHTYYPGNFHKKMTGKFFTENGKLFRMNEEGALVPYTDEEAQKLFEEGGGEDGEDSDFTARLSDEERMFKVNLVQVEQELIRMDSAAIGSEDEFGDYDGEDPDGEEVMEGPDEADDDHDYNLEGQSSKKEDSNKKGNKTEDKKSATQQMFDRSQLFPSFGGNRFPNYNTNALIKPSDIGKTRFASRSTMEGVNLMRTAQELVKEDAPVLYAETRNGDVEPIATVSSDEVRVFNSKADSKKENDEKKEKIKQGETDAETKETAEGDVGDAEEKNLDQLGGYLELNPSEIKEYSAEVDELIYQYAKYNMQLHRAMSHNLNVQLSLCLPQIRVGFNMWLEPTRTDLVFYSTSITHSGGFQSGCKTSIQGAFVRDTLTYKDVFDNVFIGDKHATSKDFGSVVEPPDLEIVRNNLSAMHAAGQTSEAHKIELLKEYYTSHNKDNEYSTKWNTDKTPSEIENLIKEEYEKAPDIIKLKIQETRQVINDSVEDFVQYLHAYAMKGK